VGSVNLAARWNHKGFAWVVVEDRNSLDGAGGRDDLCSDNSGKLGHVSHKMPRSRALNMFSLSPSAPQGADTMMRDLTWSHAEKVIARQAFRRALEREFREVSTKTKEIAKNIEQPADLWELEGLPHR